MSKKTHLYLLFIAIILPSIVNLMSRYFIGYMSYDSIVLHQSYETLEVLLEIFQEFMPLVIMGVVATSLYKLTKDEITEYINSALLLQMIVIIPFIIIMLINMDNFIDFNNTPTSVQGDASLYYTLNLFSIIPSVIYLILYNTLLSINKPKMALVSSAGILVINYFIQTLLISTSSISLQLGLIGVPISNITSYILSIIFLIIVLRKESYLFKFKIDINKIKHLINLGKYTILESFVRNIGYIFGATLIINSLGDEIMTIHNSIGEIYWSLYLIPVIAYGIYIKIQVSQTEEINKFSTFNQFFKTHSLKMTIYFIILLLLNFIFGDYIFNWLNSNNTSIVNSENFWSLFMLNSINFYLFAIITVVISYAQGKIKFNIVAIASFCINILYFIPIGMINQYTNIQINYIEYIYITMAGYIINLIIIIILIKYYYHKEKE